jgi:hypothetical protein
VNLFYSTSAYVNGLFSENLRGAIVRSAELDDNNDGIVERIEIGLAVPLTITESITKFSMLVYHDVELKDVARFRFDTVSFASYDTSIPIGSIYMDGDVMLRQQSPLDVKGG